jgi:uncharacterized protein (UPF0276 family)
LKGPGRIGILYSAAFGPWLERQGADQLLELQASQFYYPSAKLVESICRLRPTIISKGRLSLGTPGALDRKRLSAFTDVVQRTKPLWVSEPLGFSRTDESTWEADLPICPGQASLSTLVDHSREVMDACQKLLLLETTATSIRPRGSMRETDFLNLVCQKAKCGLLLDVSALLVNSINHRFDPVEWLRQVDRSFIVQLHVSGYSRRDNRLFDDHLNAVPADVWNLLEQVLECCSPRAIILEREGNYPPTFLIEEELARLKGLFLGEAVPHENTIRGR